MINTKRLGAAIMMLMAASCIEVKAQDMPESIQQHAKTDNWEPIGVWPFIYKNFHSATIQRGLFKKIENRYPCNIHVGKSTLWFSSDNENLMEAVSNDIRRIIFDGGDVYMPIGDEHALAKVIYEGELQGKTARVFLIKKVKQDAVDQMYIDHLNKTQNMLQGGAGAFFSHLADAGNQEDPEYMPLPMENVFYYFFNDKLFEANTKNILNNIKPERKKEYRAYTRSAEVLSTSEKSMMKVWNDFFVNYEKK